MPGKPNDTGYPPDVGKHAHTPKFPKDKIGFNKMKGGEKPYDFDRPIIHDDRNPDTEEPFTPIFSWILKEAAALVNAINIAGPGTPYQNAVKRFEDFVEWLHNRDGSASPPVQPTGTPPYDWARVGPTISEANIEPVFSGGDLKGAIVTVTWLGGTHTSSSSASVP